MDYQRIAPRGNRVWPDAGKNWDPAIVKMIQEYSLAYVESLDTTFEVEYEKVKDYQDDKSRTCSPLWRKFATNNSTSLTIKKWESSTMEHQLEGEKDRKKTITDPDHMDFVGALMCCDEPLDTINFLWRTFVTEHGLNFAQQAKYVGPFVTTAITALEVVMLQKHTLDVPRISQWERLSGKTKTISRIPHPAHGSLGSGHSMVAKACRVAGETIAEELGFELTKDWIDLTEEPGLARIYEGIHWFIDHEASEALLQKFKEFILDTGFHLMGTLVSTD